MGIYFKLIMGKKIRQKDIISKSEDQLKEDLKSSRKELLELTISKRSGSNEKKISLIKVVKKNIARILTSLRMKEIQKKKADWEDKAYIPKCFRPKLTHKLRTMLTPAQKNIVNRRRRILNKKYPQRK